MLNHFMFFYKKVFWKIIDFLREALIQSAACQQGLSNANCTFTLLSFPSKNVSFFCNGCYSSKQLN